MPRKSSNHGVAVQYLHNVGKKDRFYFRLYFFANTSHIVKNFLYSEESNKSTIDCLDYRAKVQMNSECKLVITKDDLGYQFANARTLQGLSPDNINIHILPGQERKVSLSLDITKISYWCEGKQYFPDEYDEFPEEITNAKFKSVIIDFNEVKEHMLFNYSEKKGTGRPHRIRKETTPEVQPSPVKIIKPTVVDKPIKVVDNKVVIRRVDMDLFIYYPDKTENNLHVLNLLNREVREASSIEQRYFKTIISTEYTYS